jgi:hypothetical protein
VSWWCSCDICCLTKLTCDLAPWRTFRTRFFSFLGIHRAFFRLRVVLGFFRAVLGYRGVGVPCTGSRVWPCCGGDRVLDVQNERDAFHWHLQVFYRSSSPFIHRFVMSTAVRRPYSSIPLTRGSEYGNEEHICKKAALKGLGGSPESRVQEFFYLCRAHGNLGAVPSTEHHS